MWTSSRPSIQLGEPAALLGGALPGAERVVVVGEAGVEVEVRERAQAHLGVRGVGVGREDRVDPAVLASRRPLHHLLHQVPGRRLALRLPLGRHLRERARVRVGADRDPAVGLLGGPLARAARSTRAGRRSRSRGTPPTGPRSSSRRAGCRRRRGPPRRRRRSAARRRPAPRSRRCRPRRPWSSSRRGSSPGSRPAGPSSLRLSFRAQARVAPGPVARHRHQQRVDAQVVGDLGVKRAGEHRALADRDRVLVDARQHLDAVAPALDPGRADEDGAQRLGPDPARPRGRPRSWRSGARTRFGARSRRAGRGGRGRRRSSRRRCRAADARPRRASRIAGASPSRSIAFMIVVDSPPGITSASSAAELLRRAHLDRVGAELGEHRAMGGEVALAGEDADPVCRGRGRARSAGLARRSSAAVLEQLVGRDLADLVAAHRGAEAGRRGRRPARRRRSASSPRRSRAPSAAGRRT